MNSGISGPRGFVRGIGKGGKGVGKARAQVESEHQNYFPPGTTTGAVPARNFSPLISDGMIIRGDISHESGTWLNVDFIAAGQRSRGRRRGGGGVRGKRGAGRKFPRNYGKGSARRDGVYEVVN